MSRYGKGRFNKGYQKHVGTRASSKLQANSKELASILKQNNVIEKAFKIFEIGAAGGRNLQYILADNPDAELEISCNDLFEKESKENMDDTLKPIINFYEGDTLEVLRGNELEVDLMISSDHLMHLEPGNGDDVLEHIKDEIKPKWILLREVKEEFEKPSHPRIFHNYEMLKEDYEIIHEQDSEQTDQFFIWLLKRK